VRGVPKRPLLPGQRDGPNGHDLRRRHLLCAGCFWLHELRGWLLQRRGRLGELRQLPSRKNDLGHWVNKRG